MLEIIFQVIGGCSQVEHGVESLKVYLNEWKFNIRFQGLECLSLENISINSKLWTMRKRQGI